MESVAAVSARTILDSHADWTIEVTVRTTTGVEGVAAVPTGESQGKHEAVAVPADEAVRHVTERISPALAGMPLGDQAALDSRLIELDGTKDKSALGANAILGTSLAYARTTAAAHHVPLWQYLRGESGLQPPFMMPRLFALFTEGGLHAGGTLPFQEYLVIPRAGALRASVELVQRFYAAYRQYLIKQFGAAATRLGDEGAFSPGFTDSSAPFAALHEVATALGIRDQVDFGLDAAASNVQMSVADLTAFYRQLRQEHGLAYFEDVFDEEDFVSFASLYAEFGDSVMIVGDDLTVTNVGRMQEAHEQKSINAIIIKPNQIGTLTETLAAIKQARQYGWHVVVSHRGRETNDDFISDLAYGVGADGLKLGAPARGERVAKYNRLLAIGD